jgi:hypothetical protein
METRTKDPKLFHQLVRNRRSINGNSLLELTPIMHIVFSSLSMPFFMFSDHTFNNLNRNCSMEQGLPCNDRQNHCFSHSEQYALWVQAGKPRSKQNMTYQRRIKSKREFRRQVRIEQAIRNEAEKQRIREIDYLILTCICIVTHIQF